jgi:hypothetical protein
MIRKLIAAVLLAAGVLFLVFVFSSDEAVKRDFLCYWSAGQLAIRRENPYGSAETLRIQRSAGYPDAEPMIGHMTPFSLPLVLPLGLIDARSGAIIWSLLIVALLIFAIHSVRQMHDRPANRLHLLGYIFAPALACILAGQAGAILLFGLVLFLRFQRFRPFAAGLSLVLWSMKPHLFFAFGVAVLFWIIANKRYRILFGVLTGLAASAVITTWIDPQAWSQYLEMMRSEHIEAKVLPNLSLIFRVAVDRDSVWLQCVPAVASVFWSLWYARRHRSDWDWMNHGSLVLLVSVLVAPYSWFTDEVLLVPAMLHAVYSADNRGQSLGWFGVPAGIALILVLWGVPLYSLYYVWTPMAWLACWLRLKRAPLGSGTVSRQALFAQRVS